MTSIFNNTPGNGCRIVSGSGITRQRGTKVKVGDIVSYGSSAGTVTEILSGDRGWTVVVTNDGGDETKVPATECTIL